MKNVIETLHTLVEVLNRLSIDYAVMGGFAVRAHGVPRPTYDIDVAVGIDRQRLPELCGQLRDYGFAIPEVYETGWVDRVKDLPLLKLKRYIRDESLDVDLFLVESEFLAEVMKRRSQLDADGRVLWVVSPEDLILFKLLAGWARDWGDIGDVLFIQGTLDEAYMRRWAGELGICNQLEKALAEQIGDQNIGG